MTKSIRCCDSPEFQAMFVQNPVFLLTSLSTWLTADAQNKHMDYGWVETPNG